MIKHLIIALIIATFSLPSYAQMQPYRPNVPRDLGRSKMLSEASKNAMDESNLYSDADKIWRKDHKLQRFLDYYYLTKPIYQAPQMMQRLIDLGFMDQDPIQQNYVIGFFAALFKNNPELVPSWLDQLEATQYQGAAYVRSLRHANLIAVAENWAAENNWIYNDDSVFEPLPMPVNEELTSPEDIQRLWGAYAAEGGEEYLDTLFKRLRETRTVVKDEQLRKGEFDDLKLQAVNETIEGLFIAAGRQYKDVEAYLVVKANEPGMQTDRQLSKIIFKIYKPDEEN